MAANQSTSPRTGTITIADKTFTVTQGADTLRLLLLSRFPALRVQRRNGSIKVTSPACPWTAVRNVSWITILSGASGLGNGTVNYSVAANTGTTTRTGIITIADYEFTVTQTAGAASCTYSITPTSNTIGASGGSGSVAVTTASNCAWTASSNNSWIGITSGASGTGNGTVAFSVSANTGASRTGTLTVAGQTFSITQAAGSTPCTYSISPVSQSFGSNGGTGSVNVTSSSGCTWTAVSNASWITILSGASGSGNGAVNYSVAANTGTTTRSGTMTVASQTFTVTQAGQSCTYSISPASQSFGSSGGTGSVNVTSSAGCTWTAVSNASWITILSGASGSGNGAVSYSVAAYSGTTSRSGTMTVASQTFTVTQAGSNATPIISVEPTLVNFGNVRVDTQSSATVKITNAGGAPLLINSIRLFGVNGDQFRQTNACTTLAPGSSCDIKVTFAPSDYGTLKGVVGITSNDPTKVRSTFLSAAREYDSYTLPKLNLSIPPSPSGRRGDGYPPARGTTWLPSRNAGHSPPEDLH